MKAVTKSTVSVPKTEVFALRLDPKLKYLAEIASRKQRRSLANFVEWAIEQALSQVILVDSWANKLGPSAADEAEKLWALDECERLEKLAKSYPSLLTYEEQSIRRVIGEFTIFNRHNKRMSKFIDEKGVDLELVRACWKELKAYALGTGSKEELVEAITMHDPYSF